MHDPETGFKALRTDDMEGLVEAQCGCLRVFQQLRSYVGGRPSSDGIA